MCNSLPRKDSVDGKWRFPSSFHLNLACLGMFDTACINQSHPAVIMAFWLKRLSSEIPNTVMSMRFTVGDSVTIRSLLPPSTEEIWQTGSEINKGSYETELHIVDPRGRSALIFLGRFGGELHYRGTVTNGGGVLPTMEGKKNSWISKNRNVGIHVRADGNLIFQAMENFHWKDGNGKELDELSVSLPAFSGVAEDGAAASALPYLQ